MAAVRANQLRTRVSLQARVVTDDGQGGEVVSFAPVATIWMNATPNGGREFQAAKKLNAELTHEITIRYRDGFLPDMRFVLGNMVFHVVTFFDPDGRRQTLTVFAKEIIA